jgi:hypothetical protein
VFGFNLKKEGWIVEEFFYSGAFRMTMFVVLASLSKSYVDKKDYGMATLMGLFSMGILLVRV